MEHDTKNQEQEYAKQAKDWKETFKKKPEQEPGVHLGSKGPKDPKKFTFSFWYFFIILLAFIMVNTFMVSRQTNVQAIDYNQFKALVERGSIRRVAIEEDKYIGYNYTKEQALTD